MKSAVILNGGKSSRLGVLNKGLLKIDEKTIIEHIISILENIFDEIIIISKDKENLKDLGIRYPVYSDIIKSVGPLSGMYTGLSYVKSDYAFFCGCDMPFINRDLILKLIDEPKDYDAVYPVFNGAPEPLCAIYNKSCMPYISALIYAKLYCITDVLHIVKSKSIDANEILPTLSPFSFMNVNTWDDYLTVCDIYKSLHT